MSGIFKNRTAFEQKISSFLPKQKERMNAMIFRLATRIHEKVTARTPVWSGEVLANYQWSMNQPRVGTVRHAETGPLERTNFGGAGPLGPESRRSPNAAIARASFESVNWGYALGNKVYLVNNVGAWGGLEKGMLPDDPERDLKPRSPKGMVGITLSEVRARMGAGSFWRRT